MSTNALKRDRSNDNHDYYELVLKEKRFNNYVMDKLKDECVGVFLKKYMKHLTEVLFPEAFEVYGSVFVKMNTIHNLITELSSFKLDLVPTLNQFRSGATWAKFTPSCDDDMEDQYDICRDLCEKECQELTPEKRGKYFKGSVFFIYLKKQQLQSLIDSCSWLKAFCAILSSKCLIQLSVMSDFVDQLSSDTQSYVHRDLLMSSSLGANFIVFLDRDITGLDGAVFKSHTNGTQHDISVSYMRSSVLYMSGKVYHASSTSRVHGIHHAVRNKSKKGDPGYVNTQRRFLLINCCPYSKLNMLDQLLNSDCYTMMSPYSLKESVFIYENNIVSELSDSEITSCFNTLKMVKQIYKK